MTHAKPWDIISEKLWMRSCRPIPGLVYWLKKHLSPLVLNLKSVEEEHSNQVLRKLEHFSQPEAHIRTVCSSRHNRLVSYRDGIQVCQWSGKKEKEKNRTVGEESRKKSFMKSNGQHRTATLMLVWSDMRFHQIKKLGLFTILLL